MTSAEKKLIAYLLRMADGEFSNHGCNDMPDGVWDECGFTDLDKSKLIQEMQIWNGDSWPENLINVQDNQLMSFLADKISGEN